MSNDVIYAPIKKRGIYIPDWSKIPVYLNLVSPGVLGGIATVGFNGTPMPGIHFAVAEQCDMDILSKEIYSAIKACMNVKPPHTIEYYLLNMVFRPDSCYDFDDRNKLLAAHCNTIEDNGWNKLSIYGQNFYGRDNQWHEMVDMNTRTVHPELIALTV